MGAANSNHVGITAFGAINTVIAGILTYLKGSGLPNRVRYYENEWKRVREYIEQRERDFSREGCDLNLNEVVSKIEAMYEQVKADIQSNTPDNYVSVGDVRAKATATMTQAAIPTPMPQVAAAMSGKEAVAKKQWEELGHQFGHKVTDVMEILANTKTQLEKNLQDAQVGARDWEKGVEIKVENMAEGMAEHARSGMRDYGKDMDAKTARFIEAEQNLERKAELTMNAAQRAGQSMQQAGDSLERAGDSVSRVARAVEDDIQPHKRD